MRDKQKVLLENDILPEIYTSSYFQGDIKFYLRNFTIT